MKIIKFHIRIMKILKIIKFHARIHNKKKENPDVTNGNHENLEFQFDNNGNH